MSDRRPPTTSGQGLTADRGNDRRSGPRAERGARQSLRLYLLRPVAAQLRRQCAALSRYCAGLTNPLISNTQSPLPPSPSILVIRPDHLGDLLFTTPALAALRNAFPDAHITCLVGPWAAEIVARNPNVDQVLTLSFPWFDRRPRSSPWQPYRILWREARRLRARRFDLALILRFDHWWGALLAYLAGIPRRVGYDLPETRPFLTRPAPYVPTRHEVLQNLELVRHLSPAMPDLPPEALRLEFTPTPEEQAHVEGWLAGRGVELVEGQGSQGDSPSHLRTPAPLPPNLVGLVPGAGAPVKRWRPEAFAQVGDELARRHDARVVITGTAGERPLAEDIAGRMTAPALVAAGETTLGQLAALLGRCRVVVGVDSGPMHLAVAQGVATVHLFGPVDPALFGPWGDLERHRVVTLEPRLPCMFCNRLDYRPEELPAHPCVRDIPVEAVLVATDEPTRSPNAQ